MQCGTISLAGDSTGVADRSYIDGSRVLAILSCKLAERPDFLPLATPGVVPPGEAAPLIPFSLVTKPLS